MPVALLFVDKSLKIEKKILYAPGESQKFRDFSYFCHEMRLTGN